MKNIPSQENTPQNPYFLFLGSLLFSAAMLLLADKVLANNAVLRSIFSCQAQGWGGAIPTLTVWYQQGTNLSFIPTGETIKKVWLDDPSQVSLLFDGNLCQQSSQQAANPGDCENSAANVIHLRRIKKLPIPGFPDTNSTLLTVVTEGQGKRKLYTFQVVYSRDTPDYNTLAVFADPPSVSDTPCILPNARSAQ